MYLSMLAYGSGSIIRYIMSKKSKFYNKESNIESLNYQNKYFCDLGDLNARGYIVSSWLQSRISLVEVGFIFNYITLKLLSSKKNKAHSQCSSQIIAPSRLEVA